MAPLSKADIELWERYTRQEASAWTVPRPSRRQVQDGRMPRTLDLHGMTLQDAWKSVLSFVEGHHDLGTGEIIIICGKGGQIARELPFWCERMRSVRCITPIVDSQGQHGSFRVKLRTKK